MPEWTEDREWARRVAHRLARSQLTHRDDLLAIVPDMGRTTNHGNGRRKGVYLAGASARHYAETSTRRSGSRGSRKAEHLRRLLRKFEMQGWVARDGDTVRTIDARALLKFSDDGVWQ